MRRALVLMVAMAALGAACGAARLPVPAQTPSSPPPATATPTPSPTPSPTPAAPTTGSFTGTISLDPAARVRFGPGLDLPVMDLEPLGRTLAFDAWFRRLDDPPEADATTGRIEWWSRDWYRLADGHGWVHSAAVNGFPPAGLAQLPWRRPAVVPASAAGLIAVTLDRQDQAASCELAALKMALAAEGIPTTETALLEMTGVDARPAEEDEHGNIRRWGNPDFAFVGDPGGRQADHTGYGVYAAPIARAAAAAGGHVRRSGTGVAAADVYTAVLGGNPVVAWVTSDYTRGTLRTWTAWDGAQVRYSLKEHAVTVVGVTPGWVLINDPWWGRLWKPKSEFEAAFATFDQMAVIA